MAENKMKEVAKLLGVELEEEFKIYGWDGFCKITELGLERYVKGRSLLMDSIMLMDLIKGTAKLIKIPKPILDEKEKEYLSAVIKPFKDTVRAIVKYDDVDYDNYSFIVIIVKQSIEGDDITNEGISLPVFKKGTMYKGMELGKRYSLEDLGI